MSFLWYGSTSQLQLSTIVKQLSGTWHLRLPSRVQFVSCGYSRNEAVAIWSWTERIAHATPMTNWNGNRENDDLSLAKTATCEPRRAIRVCSRARCTRVSVRYEKQKSSKGNSNGNGNGSGSRQKQTSTEDTHTKFCQQKEWWYYVYGSYGSGPLGSCTLAPPTKTNKMPKRSGDGGLRGDGAREGASSHPHNLPKTPHSQRRRIISSQTAARVVTYPSDTLLRCRFPGSSFFQSLFIPIGRINPQTLTHKHSEWESMRVSAIRFFRVLEMDMDVVWIWIWRGSGEGTTNI